MILVIPGISVSQMFLEDLSFPNMLLCQQAQNLEKVQFIEMERIDYLNYGQYQIKTKKFIKFQKGNQIDYVNTYSTKILLDSVDYQYSNANLLRQIQVYSEEKLQLKSTIEITYDSLFQPYRLVKRGLADSEIQQVVKKGDGYIIIQFWKVGSKTELLKFSFDHQNNCIPYTTEKEIKNVNGQIILDVIQIPKENGKMQKVLSEYQYDEKGNWIQLSTYLLGKKFRKRKRNLILKIERTIHYE